MILYIDNPKHATRKLLELINEFGKVEGNKINTQKPLAFLHNNNEISEREIKETIPMTITSKRIKYLGINLAKEAKYLYSEVMLFQSTLVKSFVTGCDFKFILQNTYNII